MKTLSLTLLLCSGLILGTHAQEFHMPAPSPSTSVKQDFSTSFIQLAYSRPAVNGRDIFGELIPYGEVWRTGANTATTVSFGEDLNLAGKPVAAGTYALYTIPGEEEWKVILNKGTDNWGVAGYDENKNVLEAVVPVIPLDNDQESLRISIEEMTKDSAKLVIAWADVKVEIPIKADNNKRIMAHLDRALQSDNPPYSAAAGYYLSTGQKMEEALKYAGKAIAENPEAYYLYWTQAQIYEKLGKHDQALKSAKKAVELTKKDHPAFIYEYDKKYKDLKNKE